MSTEKFKMFKCSFINRHDITQANNNGRTYIKTGVSKSFCTASISENYNQTTESYAQVLAVGGSYRCDAADSGGSRACSMWFDPRRALQNSSSSALSHKSSSVGASGE